MNKLFIYSAFLFLLSIQFLTAQTKYYTAAGKDSITYLATNYGMLVLTRNEQDNLEFFTIIIGLNVSYQRAADNEKYLVLSSGRVDLFSLLNKYLPEYKGYVDVPSILSIRPFGDHFLVIRNASTHYLVGFLDDSVKIITSINSVWATFSGNTAFYPEAVYPYFFGYSQSTNRVIMYKYLEDQREFLLLDTLNILEPGYTLTQMYGGKDRFFTRERLPVSGGYNIYEKMFLISNDTLVQLSSNFSVKQNYFIDEIECTDTLIRFSSSYTFLNGDSLIEPNGDLTSYSNLSGQRIYNTRRTGLPFYSAFFYSGQITGNQINSHRFFYDPVGVDDAGKEISGFRLEQNYPNPFNPTTTINLTLPEPANIKLSVYNLLGQELRVLLNEYKQAGTYEVNFDGSGLNSGLYFYKMEAGDQILVRKMLLLK